MDWNKLRDKFFKECTDASPNSGKNAGIRPVNLNAHNLFEWFRKECESKETSDESGNCIKPDVSKSACQCCGRKTINFMNPKCSECGTNHFFI